MNASLLAAVLLATVCVLPSSAAQPQYARPELLLEPTELAKPEVAKQFVILDVRSREAFGQGHIPTARQIDHDQWKAAFDGGQNVADWSRRIGQLGIGKDTKVVVYDDRSFKNAARVWWLLRFWGVDNARLLNGTWKTWTTLKLPTTMSETPPAKPVAFHAKPITKRLATMDQVLHLLENKTAQIVDARSFGEFCGKEPGKNKRGGAIPGAKHLEWSDLIDSKTGRFKSAAEIQALLDKAGIDPQHPIATHCQSGGRASVMVFGLELMGAPQVSNYYKGWSEWGNSAKTPIVPGKSTE